MVGKKKTTKKKQPHSDDDDDVLILQSSFTPRSRWFHHPQKLFTSSTKTAWANSSAPTCHEIPDKGRFRVRVFFLNFILVI